jgi:hypothetical protein
VGLSSKENTEDRMKALKGIIWGMVFIFSPVALLYAGQAEKVAATQRRPSLVKSVKTWKGMQKDLEQILSKSKSFSKVELDIE